MRGFALSPREERAGREPERGETEEKHVLSRPSPPFLRRRGRESAVARSKQIFCRTQRVCDPLRLRCLENVWTGRERLESWGLLWLVEPQPYWGNAINSSVNP